MSKISNRSRVSNRSKISNRSANNFGRADNFKTDSTCMDSIMSVPSDYATKMGLEKIKRKFKNPIPFEEMPKDIYMKISLEEYIYSIIHKEQFSKGIYEVIHLNRNHPEWTNLMISDFDDRSVVAVYTKEKGWVHMKYNEICDLLIEEWDKCSKFIILLLKDMERQDEEKIKRFK